MQTEQYWEIRRMKESVNESTIDGEAPIKDGKTKN